MRSSSIQNVPQIPDDPQAGALDADGLVFAGNVELALGDGLQVLKGCVLPAPVEVIAGRNAVGWPFTFDQTTTNWSGLEKGYLRSATHSLW
jgi:hypothetical protein